MVLPAWIVATIVSVVLNVAAIIIAPKPKGAKPPEVQQADAPTASGGKPIPVIFGTVMVKEVNILWYGEMGAHQYQVSV